jgi:GNAT superfamily N-acetyltransferase
MNTVAFRQATPADATQVAYAHTASWRDAYGGILPAAYLDGPIADERARLWRSRLSAPGVDRRYVLLAECGGQLIGFVCVLLDEEPAWGACLDNLHVLPPWRGGGLGRRLFGRAAQWVSSTEPGWGMHLWVFEANLGARRLYDALGGEVVEHRRKKVVKGIEIPSVRYFWHDLRDLLQSLVSVSVLPGGLRENQ